MPFLMVVGAMGFMFGTGGSALIARIMGEGRREKAQEIFSLLIAATVVSGLVIAVISILFYRRSLPFLARRERCWRTASGMDGSFWWRFRF